MTPAPREVRTRVRMSAEGRRSQILDAATLQIADRGFWGLTLREVAAACGITEAGVLHHVGSKDGLLVAVLEHRDLVDNLRLAERLGIPVESLDDDPVPVGLRALCSAFMARNAAQPEIVRLYTVLQAESLNEGHPAYDYFQSREKWATELFSRAAHTDGVAEGDVAATAREILAGMDGLQLRWLRDPEGVDLLEMWEDLASRILAGR